MSLNDSTVSIMLPISDTDRAQQFYSDRLGLPYEGVNDDKELQYRLAGGARLVLLPRPDQKPLSSTAMSFQVHGIEDEITQLESRGVTFEDYDLPDLHTEGHIASRGGEKAAWFLDPDGNVLCLHESP